MTLHDMSLHIISSHFIYQHVTVGRLKHITCNYNVVRTKVMFFWLSDPLESGDYVCF